MDSMHMRHAHMHVDATKGAELLAPTCRALPHMLADASSSTRSVCAGKCSDRHCSLYPGGTAGIAALMCVMVACGKVDCTQR